MLEIYCINLDHRVDRWNESTSNYISHGLNPNLVQRWIAINESEFGALGCAKSHVSVLSHFLTRTNSHYCLILEDDFDFVRPWDAFIECFNKFSEKQIDWDVILLTGTALTPYKIIDSNITRVWRSHTTAGYFVSRNYASILLGCFATGVTQLETMSDPAIRQLAISTTAIDILWQPLQRRDRWYIFTPSFGRQRPSFSDIEQGYRNYDPLTYGLSVTQAL